MRKVSNAKLLKEKGALTACWLKRDPWMGSEVTKETLRHLFARCERRSAVQAPALSNAFVLCQAKKRLRCSGLGTKQTAALDESRRRFLAMNL